MKIYNIHQAKTHLSRLVEAAAAGEEILIAKAGKPMAKLVAA
ncbi:MAG: type II toxin-antitoxin system prevent-host-death family antitoxin [Gemmatimonadetes bacterium]|nr:type II toxin-antitoxin system prevent-host-death family antitoxin [Gemmatimonadota bacterium]